MYEFDCHAKKARNHGRNTDIRPRVYYAGEIRKHGFFSTVRPKYGLILKSDDIPQD